MSGPEKSEKENDYSLTMHALYNAFYSIENPYTDSKESVFVLLKKPTTPLKDRLLEKTEDKKTPLFASPSDYGEILHTYHDSDKPIHRPVSGSHKLFLITHLGGWKSGKVDLADKTDPIFHDNSRPDGGIREEFFDELLNWKYARDEKGDCRFFQKNRSVMDPLPAGSRHISEYIVECNHALISNYYVRKDILRQIILDFADNMGKAERIRLDNGENSLISDPENEKVLDELKKCLKEIIKAYDQLPDSEVQREWLLSRALSWLVIAAFLRKNLTGYVIDRCLKPYMFKVYQIDTAEDITETKKSGAKTETSKNGREETVFGISAPELFWSAGKTWYEEARRPGARFHSLYIVNHILPSAEDKPAGSEYSFPFRATDTNENIIQCARFSELLRDKNSIYHQGHFMLIGEGGIGKTTTLMSAMQDAYEGRDTYKGESVIPLFVELSLAPDSQDSHAYDGTSSSVIHRLVYAMLQQKDSKKDRADLLRESMNEESSTARDTVRELLTSAADEEIRYVLLIDGLNEVSPEPFTGRSSSAQWRILQEIREMIEGYPNVTVILTGRQGAFIDHPSFHPFYLRGLVWKEIEDYLREKGKTDREIFLIRSGDKGLLKVLSIPMFLTMYVLLRDTEGITTRGELLKVFFHERFEKRKNEFTMHRQGDISERIDQDKEQSVSGKMTRGKITIPVQWMFLDILIPEIAAKMEREHDFCISKKDVRSLLDSLFKEQDSLYCGKYKGFSDICFSEQLQGEDLEDVISDFIEAYKYKPARYSSAFLRYCESSMGILYKEGEQSYGFVHQHFWDYFAAVCSVNRMKIAYTAFQEGDTVSARKIMRQYDKAPLDPVLMVYIGEYLGEHHNAPHDPRDAKVPSETNVTEDNLRERRLVSNLFDIYRKVEQEGVYGVYNLMEILKRVRKDLSGSDFHDLDLRQCRFSNVHLDSGPETVFKDAVINGESWLAEGHSDIVTSAVFSVDGRLVATASEDKTARIWDSRTEELLQTLEGHSDIVTGAAFSADGRLVVTTSEDKTARIWDSRTGELLQTLEGHYGGVNSAAFSADRSHVVTASFDGTARIWDSRTGELLNTLGGHSSWVNSAVFSVDGCHVVTASDDGTARIWDVETGELQHTMGGHSDSVTGAVFSADGKLVVTTSEDNTARIWDSRTGEQLHTLGDRSFWVTGAAFSADGRLVVTASWDRTARIWDSHTGELLHTMEGKSGGAIRAVFNVDGRLVVTASRDRTVWIWDSRTGELLQTLEGHIGGVNSAAFSADRSLVVTSSEDGTARIWDSRTGDLLNTLEGHSGGVNSAVFSVDGSFVATASDDNTARIWDSRTGELRHTLSHSGWVTSAVFSVDGSLVVTASRFGSARIWDSRTGELLHTLDCFELVTSAGISVDGSLVATASRDRTVWIWDSRTGELLQTMVGHSDIVTSAAFSVDGSLVVTASRDRTVRIWDSRTGELLRTLEGHFGGVNSAAFSVDGSLVVTASADGTARIWDSRTGELLQTLEGHSGWVTSTVFSIDGSLMATASYDGTVRIWDVETGKTINTLHEITGLYINGVSFKDISPMSTMTDKQKEIFRQYGAII